MRRRLWEAREYPSLLTRWRSGGERRREERELERREGCREENMDIWGTWGFIA